MAQQQTFYVDVTIDDVELTDRAIARLEDRMDPTGAHVSAFSGTEGRPGQAYISIICDEVDVFTAGWVAVSLCEVFDAPVRERITSLNIRNAEAFDAEE